MPAFFVLPCELLKFIKTSADKAEIVSLLIHKVGKRNARKYESYILRACLFRSGSSREASAF